MPLDHPHHHTHTHTTTNTLTTHTHSTTNTLKLSHLLTHKHILLLTYTHTSTAILSHIHKQTHLYAHKHTGKQTQTLWDRETRVAGEKTWQVIQTQRNDLTLQRSAFWESPPNARGPEGILGRDRHGERTAPIRSGYHGNSVQYLFFPPVF